ncbi:MAG: ribosome recycling factor [Pelagibacterales bacterium]|nr:ribosome recycling factor [Pelagibacterales bacterium]OUU63564.1 MAG: ribosome recycling factor [Alphaproteobacteria bacterium TMED62]|tara:strand:+ start:6910 stop:7464 length:555 start_codon:yes stop_codon:yes gene_type:complete
MNKLIMDDYEKRMQGTIDNLINNFSGIRSGRASSTLVDSLIVDAYGQNMKIKDLASVNVPEARTIKINVWDTNLVSAVEKSIINSSLGLSPMTEGQIIRINLPELTAERRQELAKNVKRIAEESKISIRNIRQDGMNSIKKLTSENVPEDEIKNLQDDLQKLTDIYIEKISEKSKNKENEILQI